jgi:predicted TPR repeat methyltransferase
MTETDNSPTGTDDQSVLEKAMALHQQGHLEPAVKLYQELLEKNPDNPDALHYLGMAACSGGHFEQAFELISKAISIAPGYVQAINNLGVICQSMGKLPEAEECYHRVIELKPDHGDSYNNLGTILKGQGRMSEAGKTFQMALSHDPDHARAHHNLGNLYLRAGHPELAAPHFRSAIKNGLKTIEARQALVSISKENGDHEGAVAAVEQWLFEDPENPVAMHLQAALDGGRGPARASDHYVKTVFDGMAESFDESLSELDYRAPELVMNTLNASLTDGMGAFQVLDAGCGTGLVGPMLRPLAARLVGIDLSPGMLKRAMLTEAYDELHEAELTEFLQGRPDTFDIIICADTLCYFGDLADVTDAAAASLKSGGRYIFTVEQLEDEKRGGFLLQHSGRYSHSQQYIAEVLEHAGFTLVSLDVEVLRKETGHDVNGLVVNATISQPD